MINIQKYETYIEVLKRIIELKSSSGDTEHLPVYKNKLINAEATLLEGYLEYEKLFSI